LVKAYAFALIVGRVFDSLSWQSTYFYKR